MKRPDDHGRDDWILRVGRWLTRHGFEGDPQALGVAYFVVCMKGIPGAPSGSVWAGAKPGSPAWEWAIGYSNLRHLPNETWGQALAREIAAGEMRSEVIPILGHDRRKNRHTPLFDPDVPPSLEPRPRRPGAGRPLAGADPLIVIAALCERGYGFPPGLLRNGELEQVRAFLTRSAVELEAEWGVKPEALRKRRSRLRKRMSQIVYQVEGGRVEAPTIVERLAAVEERLAEHDRQLGLVRDEDAEAAVEAFLSDLEDERDA